MGGGLRLLATSLKTNATHLEFVGNIAKRFGGGISSSSALKLHVVEISATFTQNEAACGGAFHAEGMKEIVIFVRTEITNNSQFQTVFKSTKNTI